MDCQICVEDLGDKAYCLPCGHLYCVTCINRLQQQNTRNRSIECPCCRKVAPSRIGPENIRKIFLNPSSPKVQALQVRLQEAEKERDNALRVLGRLSSTRIDPFIQALDTKDALLAIKNKELEQLKAELDKAKAMINTVLEEKERQIREARENFSQLTKEYQKEASKHWKARSELQVRDAEITKLNEVVASSSPQVGTDVWTSTYNFLYDTKGALSLGLTSPPPIQTESAGALELKNTQGTSRHFPSSPLRSPPTSTFGTSSSIVSSASIRKDASPIDPDRTLVDHPQAKIFTSSFTPERGSRLSSHSSSSANIAGPASGRVKGQTTTLPHSSRKEVTQVAKVKPKPPKERALKRGNEINWSGYSRPENTSVPECTATDGCHVFSGKGTNQYATRYTCTICHFSCSESRRPLGKFWER
ncbi:hypothetical protein BYT27DRAFT_7192256 [Phlegmacium glaucopus]|nr:hypothetical protein BYT27DRAFT_7192256 [Phlegmacium glaucopus]